MPRKYEPTGGQPGKTRKPSGLKVLHGDLKSVPAHEPVPASAIRRTVTKPALMSPAASAEWDKIAPDMLRCGVLTEWDVPLFVEWCESLILVKAARVRAAQELTGKLIVPPGAPSPLTQYHRALVLCMSLAARFGLTPADRSRLVMPDRNSGGSRADLIS